MAVVAFANNSALRTIAFMLILQFCIENNCIYVNPVIDIKNKSRAAVKKIEQSVAFMGEPFDAKKALETHTTKLLDAQVENYTKLLEQ